MSAKVLCPVMLPVTVRSKFLGRFSNSLTPVFPSRPIDSAAKVGTVFDKFGDEVLNVSWWTHAPAVCDFNKLKKSWKSFFTSDVAQCTLFCKTVS